MRSTVTPFMFAATSMVMVQPPKTISITPVSHIFISRLMANNAKAISNPDT